VNNALENKLTQRKIKPTAMRLLVLRELVESKSTLNLKELERRFDHVDRVTLYRTLKTFESNKLIHSIEDGTGSVKYALCEEECACNPDDQHVHFHCVNCNETFCLTKSKIPNVQIPSGFEVNSVNMVYQGVCPNCK
jgi:Fur family ferric uptake transcriptional regulator